MFARRSSAASGKTPEPAGQVEPVEDRLILLASVRTPVRCEAVVPPSVREFAQLGHGDGRAGLACAEPMLDALFRPEEVHRASGEDDVVPPAGGGDEAVEEQALVVWAAAVHFDRDGLAAVRARGLDPAVRLERRADSEGVPGAVSVPPAATRHREAAAARVADDHEGRRRPPEPAQRGVSGVERVPQRAALAGLDLVHRVDDCRTVRAARVVLGWSRRTPPGTRTASTARQEGTTRRTSPTTSARPGSLRPHTAFK